MLDEINLESIWLICPCFTDKFIGFTCVYLYDFGDSWHHRITVEAIEDIEEEGAGTGNAWVEAGERACPREDAGGAGSYQESLETLENEPYSNDAVQFRE